MKTCNFFSVLFFALVASWASNVGAETTALDLYIAKPDPNYGYTHLETRIGEGYTIHEIAMTSQAWRTPAEVDRTLWQHEVLIAVPWFPVTANQHTALLVINGGQNQKATSGNDALIGLLSVATGAVSAMVNQVPNQPLTFTEVSGNIKVDGTQGSSGYVTQADVAQSNGMIHILNGVLIPEIKPAAAAEPAAAPADTAPAAEATPAS